MALGRSTRGKRDETPVEPVPWQDVRNFRVTAVERPQTPKRRRGTSGARAVRVHGGGKDFPVNAPCAYFAPADSGVLLPSARELTLFEDEACRRLLCYVEAPAETGGERHHTVRDGAHGTVGVLRRIPPRRPFRHTWRIDQPGHPGIVGRNEWASGGGTSKAEFAAMTVLKAGFSVLEGGRDGARRLEWWSGDDQVMDSVGSDEMRLHADWFDRRLAFAFALVGDR